MCSVPTRMPGGKPVTEMPGLRPRSPVITLAPALVTVEAARTANVPATPRFGAVSVLATNAPDTGWARIVTAGVGVLGNLLAALDTPSAAEVARAIAGESVAKLRIAGVMEVFSVG